MQVTANFDDAVIDDLERKLSLHPVGQVGHRSPRSLMAAEMVPELRTYVAAARPSYAIYP